MGHQLGVGILLVRRKGTPDHERRRGHAHPALCGSSIEELAEFAAASETGAARRKGGVASPLLSTCRFLKHWRLSGCGDTF